MKEFSSEIDFVFARARLAYQMNAFRPVLDESGIIELNRARHPLLGGNRLFQLMCIWEKILTFWL